MAAEATTSAGGTCMKCCAGATKSRKEHSSWDTFAWEADVLLYCERERYF